MSDTGKQSPLGVNVNSSLLQNKGLGINPVVIDLIGLSKYYADYTWGAVTNDTVLRLLTWSINDAYMRSGIIGASRLTVDTPTYENLITIGGATQQLGIVSITSTPESFTVIHNTGSIGTLPAGTYVKITSDVALYNDVWLINSSSQGTFTVLTTADPGPALGGTVIYNTLSPALGNSNSFAFTYNLVTQGPFGTGVLDQTGLTNTFVLSPAPMAWGGTNWSIYKNKQQTQWGWARLFAHQAYDEWNNNNTMYLTGEYKDYLASFMNADSFVKYTNDAIMAMDNSKDFLKGTYSNMNDLISADITGISLATYDLGQDLVKSGKAINLRRINTFGLPANLLETLQENNAITKSLVLAMLGSGLTHDDVTRILVNVANATTEQQKKLYSAFVIIVGQDLQDILIALNCKTQGLETLADLLNPKKLFPSKSRTGKYVYETLTVPVYNATTQPTNSKTYYFIYGQGSVNSQLSAPNVVEKVAQKVVVTPPVATPIPKVTSEPTTIAARAVEQLATTQGITAAAAAVKVVNDEAANAVQNTQLEEIVRKINPKLNAIQADDNREER